MAVSEGPKAAAPAEHLVRHDVPEILVEKPNMVKPGVRKGSCLFVLIITSSLVLMTGNHSSLDEQRQDCTSSRNGE